MLLYTLQKPLYIKYLHLFISFNSPRSYRTAPLTKLKVPTLHTANRKEP